MYNNVSFISIKITPVKIRSYQPSNFGFSDLLQRLIPKTKNVQFLLRKLYNKLLCLKSKQFLYGIHMM